MKSLRTILLFSIFIFISYSDISSQDQFAIIIKMPPPRISIEAITPYEVRISWGGEIFEKYISDIKIRIFRRFINNSRQVADVRYSDLSYVDTVPYDGTDFYYKSAFVFQNNIASDYSDEKKISLPIDSSNPRKPFWSWYDAWQFIKVTDKYLMFDDNYKTVVYNLHGTEFVYAYESDLLNYFKEEDLFSYGMHNFKLFNRHWSIFEAFPLTQYRFVLRTKGEYVVGETMIGLEQDYEILKKIDFSKLDTYEMFGHGIGHAWWGGTIPGEGWIREGFDEYYGVVVTDLAMNFLTRFLNDYKTKVIGTPLDIPIVEMYNLYRGTPNAWIYYQKGALLVYLINKILIDNDSKTFNQFCKEVLYQKYKRTPENPWIYLTTSSLLNELSLFSSYDFTSFFSKYIYSNEPLPITRIEPKYISEYGLY